MAAVCATVSLYMSRVTYAAPMCLHHHLCNSCSEFSEAARMESRKVKYVSREREWEQEDCFLCLLHLHSPKPGVTIVGVHSVLQFHEWKHLWLCVPRFWPCSQLAPWGHDPVSVSISLQALLLAKNVRFEMGQGDSHACSCERLCTTDATHNHVKTLSLYHIYEASYDPHAMYMAPGMGLEDDWIEPEKSCKKTDLAVSKLQETGALATHILSVPLSSDKSAELVHLGNCQDQLWRGTITFSILMIISFVHIDNNVRPSHCSISACRLCASCHISIIIDLSTTQT